MNNKVLLSTALMIAMGLTGCQAMSSNSEFANDSSVNNVVWKKSGEGFQQPNDSTLKANESRIVFLRKDDSDSQKDPVVVGVGSNGLVGVKADNFFQTSLENNHYSDVVICNDSQVVTAQNMNNANGQVMAQSKRFIFMPQTTTYLQVSLSATGEPAVQQVSSSQATSLLEQSTRQAHQISRIFIECSAPKPVVTPPPVVVSQPLVENALIRNERQFTVLFDFDSTQITNETLGELGLMADFIQTRSTNDIVLEGHTDSKGAENYNLKLSQDRANVAKDILVNRYGIDSMKLRPVGYGESHPVDTNNTDQGRQNNRRVVATVVSEQ